MILIEMAMTLLWLRLRRAALPHSYDFMHNSVCSPADFGSLQVASHLSMEKITT